jgi:hypothetical protein
MCRSLYRALPPHKLLPPIAALIVLLVAARAEAAKVVILRPAGASPELNETLSRLQGEVLSLGLEVSIVERPATPYTTATESRARMERTASECGSDAVIDVIGDAAPAAVDILVLEGGARRSEIARVTLEPEADNAPERLAIRAIDALRARLVEIDLIARRRGETSLAREAPAAVISAPPHDAVDRRGRVDLEAGAAMLTSVDGVGPALMPIVRFGWAARPPLVLQAALAGFGSRPSVAIAAGGARIAQQYAVLGACYCGGGARTVQPAFALSAGVLRTAVDGEADAPSAPHSIEQWSFLLDGSAGARLNLPGRYHLTLAAHVQVAAPYIAIHIVDTVVATSGRPNFLVSLTVGAWL